MGPVGTLIKDEWRVRGTSMKAPTESLLYRCVLGRKGKTDNDLSAMHLVADHSIKQNFLITRQAIWRPKLKNKTGHAQYQSNMYTHATARRVRNREDV